MKFVIHRHTTVPDHYDLMIEREGYLETYRIDEHDMMLFLQGDEVASEKIGDHGKDYLTYEGPISCDRGHVSLFDEGEYSVERRDADGMVLRVRSKKLEGDISFRLHRYRGYLLRYESSAG